MKKNTRHYFIAWVILVVCIMPIQLYVPANITALWKTTSYDYMLPDLTRLLIFISALLVICAFCAWISLRFVDIRRMETPSEEK